MTAIACSDDAATTSLIGSASSDRLFETNRTLANRRNAQKSTGPRTPAGRSKSSQNSTRHGLRAAAPPPDLLNDPTYCTHQQEMRKQLRPATPTQHLLFDQL